MISVSKDKLNISIGHPAPMEFSNDLRIAIISAIQHMELHKETEIKEFNETTYTLLELLKNLE